MPKVGKSTDGIRTERWEKVISQTTLAHRKRANAQMHTNTLTHIINVLTARTVRDLCVVPAGSSSSTGKVPASAPANVPRAFVWQLQLWDKRIGRRMRIVRTLARLSRRTNSIHNHQFGVTEMYYYNFVCLCQFSRCSPTGPIWLQHRSLCGYHSDVMVGTTAE